MKYCKIENHSFVSTDFETIKKFSLDVKRKDDKLYQFSFETAKEESVISDFKDLFILFLNGIKGAEWIKMIENDGSLNDISNLRLRKASISCRFLKEANKFFIYEILVSL